MLDALESCLARRIAHDGGDPLTRTAFEAEAEVILRAAGVLHATFARSRLQEMRARLACPVPATSDS